ncbi:MAG: MBL fold metallo-hydrolase [Gammaproteobacteria bacterium]|nr:MBL fold metallo-hydrolase [Gammaproteobacteria bacterium]
MSTIWVCGWGGWGLEILHHGAAGGVTGSCHRLRVDAGHSYLVDCGLFQGDEAGPDPGGDAQRPARNLIEGPSDFERHQIEFPLDDVQALIVTHVHIDHVGRLPYLLAAGFRGPIYCSIPSARLLPLVIEDALRVGFTRNARLIEATLEQMKSQIVPLDYRTWQPLPSPGHTEVRVRLQRAGHILGSAYVEFDLKSADQPASKSERIVFSGDLGAPWAPLLPAPKPPQRADVVVLESTYGNRVHDDRQHRKQRLKAAIDHALTDGGTVMIPAFSIGRTQELLYELEGLIHDARTKRWRDLEVIVDSPLAARFTDVYRELKPYWDAEAHRRLRVGRHPLSFDNLYVVDSHDDHESTVRYLAGNHRPAVVIAASGMAAGGRIVNYLKAMIGDPRHAVLFVGYQARGTPGHRIQRVGPKQGRVTLDGESHRIRAQVTTISGYSAHADQADLVRFVTGMRRMPREVRLIHGEQRAKQALQRQLQTAAKGRGQALEVTLATPT